MSVREIIYLDEGRLSTRLSWLERQHLSSKE